METTIGQRMLAAVIAYELRVSPDRAMEEPVWGLPLHPFWEEFGAAALGSFRPATGEPTIGELLMAATIAFKLEVPTERVLKNYVQERVLTAPDRGWEEFGEKLLKSLHSLSSESGKAN